MRKHGCIYFNTRDLTGKEINLARVEVRATGSLWPLLKPGTGKDNTGHLMFQDIGTAGERKMKIKRGGGVAVLIHWRTSEQ